MPDYAGSLQRIALSRTLWLVVAWPVLGSVWQLVVVRRRVARARGERATIAARASGRFAGIAFIILTTASTLAHVAVLARTPGGARALFEQGPRAARFGWFEADLAFWFDALSADACVFACLVTLAAALSFATRPAPQRGWRDWAWLQLALAGALVTFLADGFVTTAVGWTMAGVAGAWLAGWRHPRMAVVAATRSAMAMAAMLVGATLLFWGLAGSWSGDDYIPDSAPFVVAVHEHRNSLAASLGATESPATVAPSLLTLAGIPDAIVLVGEARSSALRAPFVRARIASGAHVFHLRRGNEPDDEAVGPVAVAGGEEVALVPVGPTFAFRAIADQLTLRDATGNEAVRQALEARAGPAGSTVAAAALTAWLIAAGTMSGAVRSGGAPPQLAAVARASTSATLGPYLLARLSFLFPLAPYTGVVIAWLGGAMLVAAVWRALAFSGLRRWVIFAGSTPAALGCVALGVGGVVDAELVVGAAGLVALAAHLHAASRYSALDDSAPSVDPLDAIFLVTLPERLGVLLMRMERWVVAPVARAAAGTIRAAAWVIATSDRQLVSAPADAAATGLVRASRKVEPIVGSSIGRVAWAIIATAALAALAHALSGGG